MSQTSKAPSLLVIGGTKAGKTHYGGQLLRRLQTKTGQLRMVGTPDDLSVFEGVCACLAEGRSAPHTPTSSYRESVWQVQLADGSLHSQLVWPDYGGEQVERITQLRQVPEQWVRRIRKSDGWLLIVRPGALKTPEDVLVRPRAKGSMTAGAGHTQQENADLTTNENIDSTQEATAVPPADITDDMENLSSAIATSVNLSDQARLVELLQAMLFVKQVGTHHRLHHPKLIIILSCWDELDSKKGKTPAVVLQKRLPLLSQFVSSNWNSKAFDVIGISALGKALMEDSEDEEFREYGPERQGWCIMPDGEVNKDLTYPVAMLMAKTTGS